MKVVHIAPVTPQRCGLWETARELVAAERSLGIDAMVFDPRPPAGVVKPEDTRVPDWTEDRGTFAVPFHVAVSSDVVVSHSGLDSRWDICPAPRIHVAHGRPNSSYRIERAGETPIYETYSKMNQDPRWKTMVTLWPGYEDYLRLLFPNVELVPSWVDLKHWTPGRSDHNWDGRGGRPNVLIADIWRMDKDPFHVLNAFAVFARTCPTARVHIVGLDKDHRGRGAIFDGLCKMGVLGQLVGMVQDLRPFYRAADMMITPHDIATRTVREALACGCQVVAGADNPYTPYRANPEALGAFAGAMAQAWVDLKADRPGCRIRNRARAEAEFDLDRSAKKFIGILENARRAA